MPVPFVRIGDLHSLLSEWWHNSVARNVWRINIQVLKHCSDLFLVDKRSFLRNLLTVTYVDIRDWGQRSDHGSQSNLGSWTGKQRSISFRWIEQEHASAELFVSEHDCPHAAFLEWLEAINFTDHSSIIHNDWVKLPFTFLKGISVQVESSTNDNLCWLDWWLRFCNSNTLVILCFFWKFYLELVV